MKERFGELTADDRPFSERLALALTAAFLFSFTLLLFAPFELYFSNAAELWFPFSRIWWCFALLFVCALLLLTGLGLLLRGELLNRYAAFLFGLCLALYVQGNFLNIDYGPLNGAEIRWERYGAYSIFNTLVFLFIFLLPFFILAFFKKAFASILRFVTVTMVLMQIVTLCYMAFILRPVPLEGDYGLGWEGALDVSAADDNIVVLVLDTFDNKFLEPLLAEDPAALDFMEGFTYYENTLGTYKFTFPSMTVALTGQLHTEESDFTSNAAYLNRAWRSDELFTKLHELGYDIRLLGASQYLGEARPDLIDNYMSDPKIVTSYPGLISKFLTFEAFKYLPHALKPGFWLYTGEFNQYRALSIYHMIDPLTYQRFINEPISADAPAKTFRLYHLVGMHTPYTLSREVTEVSEDESSRFIQSQGTLKFWREIIEQLKASGAYDRSTVVVMADHGLTHDNIPDDAYNPILFIKPKGAKGPLKTSAAPAWLMDLKPTLLHAAGYDGYADYGASIFDLTEETERERYFYCTHAPDENGAGTTEFVITGDANDYSNWKRTGRTWAAGGTLADAEIE